MWQKKLRSAVIWTTRVQRYKVANDGHLADEAKTRSDLEDSVEKETFGDPNQNNDTKPPDTNE